MLVVAGILLVTPGLITDVFGFMFALPGSRHIIAAHLSKHMKLRVVTQAGAFNQQSAGGQHNPFESAFQQHQSGQSNYSDNGDVFEGEYSDKTQNDNDKRLN